jgi:deoxycytidine triphosphate deaminase
MVLNKEEIKSRCLLSRTDDKHFKAASYDLTVGKIVTMDGKIHDEYIIPPRGMVLLISEEVFNLPNDILGITTVKNSLSIMGLLGINVGLVDPAWKEPISSCMINFGSQKQPIRKGDEFLRMSFHEIKSYEGRALKDLPELRKYTDNNVFDDYLKKRKDISVKNFADTFLSINSIKNELYQKIISSAFKSVFYIAALVAILSFLKPYFNQFLNDNFSYFKQEVKKEQIDSIEIKIHRLEKIIEYNKTK